jgi:hypothetical protein
MAPRRAPLHMVMMLAPSRAAGDDAATTEAAEAEAEAEAATAAKPRRAPQARAAGSAEPAEINPEQI